MLRTSLPIISLFLVMSDGAKITSPRALSKSSSCSCIYDGEYYNLRSLASKDKEEPALWGNSKDGYIYAYNPCIPFTLKGACRNVAVCRWFESDPNSYLALGLQNNVTCRPAVGKDIDKNIKVELVFQQPGAEQKGWITTVWMKCNKSLEIPKFSIPIYEAIPTLQVEHKCCCPNMCPDFSPLPTPDPSTKKYGGIIGGAVGGIVLVILTVFVFRHCKKKNVPIVPPPPRDYGGLAYRRLDGGGDNADVDNRPVEHDHPDQPEQQDEAQEDRSPSVPIQVSERPENQCCVEDEVLVLPASPGPVEHPDV